MRAFSVAMLGDYFTSWMGGANFLGFMFNGMLQAAPSQHATVHLLMRHTNLPEALQREVKDFLPLRREQLNTAGPLKCLLDNVPQITHVLFYRDLPATLDALQIDVIGPTGDNLGSNFSRPWFAYLPDFQHQYLTRFFSQRDRVQRDQHFRTLVENSHGVFVNSAAVVSDVQRFYAGAAQSQRIYRFPQMLADVSVGREGIAQAQDRLGIGRHPYLISCSQRWLHKQHELVIGAFAEFIDAHPQSPLHLVFTGEKTDYRNPAYAQAVQALIERFGLQDRIHDLGLIDRVDQLRLIAGARALVQASLFEGGPGASGSMEAALLGTTVLASDIDANRELPFGRLKFFDRQRSSALAELIGQLPSDEQVHDVPYAEEHIEFLTTAGGLQLLAALRSALPEASQA